jgi:hypothetical protein
MDYVYICRSGDNEELRYSLRSLQKNLPSGNVWLVGGKPDWYIGNYLQVDDLGNKFDNITNCYKALQEIDSLSNNFVLMNDDFFILKPITEVPIIYHGTLENKIANSISVNGISRYSRTLVKAKKDLLLIGIKNPLCYDVHFPMVFNKDLLKKMNHTNNAPRSTYGNIYNIGGIELNDVKIYKTSTNIDISGSSFISTEDNSFYLIEDSLRQLFPDPSMFEKQ